ncbi:hypothetical protein DPEC_G00156220 [Dallia pectoralis]|uniref:Uncharacterized protein n=1 Tax=Dallia pectoralis TaxID=75939 RepID=A0ACC2GKZ9_DALPE|nr:hypothetical protein DPEC_G00156220 [Dallia pectoralis]
MAMDNLVRERKVPFRETAAHSVGQEQVCGQENHLVVNCALRPNICNVVQSLLSLPVVLTTNWMSLCLSGLIDSGATGNFVDAQFAARLGIQLNPFK